MLNINQNSIIASNIDMLGVYMRKSQGLVDVVIMQMAAILQWRGSLDDE